MKGKIRFIHTADIHLGRPLNCGGEPSSDLASVFKNADYRSLEKIFDKALEYEVDFILISGDLYDQEARSIEASKYFIDSCQRLKEKNIPLYIISGNHDPLGRQKEPFALPENVYIFDSEDVEVREYQRQGESQARILGQSYRNKFESRKMYSFYTVPDQNLINLGILHSQLDPQNKNYVPVSKNELLNKDDINYWALGHIHQPRVLNSKNPVIVFPGTPQGRDIGETGIRGCFLVEIDNDLEPEIQFIPTARVILKRIEIKIDEKEEKKPGNLSDLEELLLEKAETILTKDPCVENDIDQENINILKDGYDQWFKGYIVRWVITGRGPVHDMIEENREEAAVELIAKLNNRLAERDPLLWSHSMVFHTGRDLPDIDDFIKNNQVFKEINQTINDIKDDRQLQKKLIKNWGRIWEGSSDHEEQEWNKFHPDQQTIKEILNEARQRIIEELFERGEKS